MTIRENITLTETTDGGFVLDRTTGSCFSLNRIGLYAWHCLAEGKSVEEVIESISVEYGDVPRETVANDVAVFIAGLRQRDLVTS